MHLIKDELQKNNLVKNIISEKILLDSSREVQRVRKTNSKRSISSLVGIWMNFSSLLKRTFWWNKELRISKIELMYQKNASQTSSCRIYITTF